MWAKIHFLPIHEIRKSKIKKRKAQRGPINYQLSILDKRFGDHTNVRGHTHEILTGKKTKR